MSAPQSWRRTAAIFSAIVSALIGLIVLLIVMFVPSRNPAVAEKAKATVGAVAKP